MAEAVLFTLTNDILKLASSNIFSKIQLTRGASDDLKGLKYTVKTIQTMLLDAEKKQWDSEQVKLWLMRLKDVLYDAQDLLDDVATEDLRWKVTPGNKMSKAVCFFFSKSNQLAQPYKVAKRIQKIRKKLDWIAKDREFRLEDHRSEATVAIVKRRTTDSFVRKEEIIGRQSDEREIIKSLLDSSSKENVSVVPIVGMGGIGKTTLARLAYNNDKVTNNFELKMWACVSDVFDLDFLIRQILKSARDKYQGDPEMARNLQDIDNKCKEELQGLLRKVLDGKKYFLVLDDLWNEKRERWLELQRLLMGGSLGSKILVTTRNHSVVEAIGTKLGIYNLNVLSEDESWDLFKKTAFGDEEELLNQKLEQIGRDIVKKCSRVPLAIKTIGNLLFAKNEKEWLYFKEHAFSKIDTLNPGIMEVLKMSYDHLQPRLKHCFAYCALFPKDYVFNKQTMIHLWMAQGFIESLDENEELEEIGDDYVSDLLCGSFLEVEEVDPNTGKVKLFKMHDLMHDLALKVAGNECKMVNLNKGKDNMDEDTRHASFDLQLPLSLQEVTSLLEATNLRTFLSLRGRNRLSPNECHQIFSKLRHCRALGFERVNFCIPSSLGSRLKHLRFLEVFMNPSIKSLPDSITDLLNLQTLKLSRCENLKTLPKDLRKLIKLRYLSIVGCNSLSHLPPLSELSSLRTLSLVSLLSLEFDPLQLQSSTTQPFFPSLESLTLFKCRKLKGRWIGRQVMMAFQKHQSDNSRSSFPKLRSMVIQHCSALNFVPPFPQVEYLKIDDTKILEDWLTSLDCPSEQAVGSTFIPFSKLKHLNLWGENMKTSIFETILQLASNLESLDLGRCNLRDLSLGMQHLSSLQELRIWGSVGLDLSCQEDEQGTQWQFLKKLRVLKISYHQDLVTLPEWIQHATILQSLEIFMCESLTSLPEWIENFSLLEKLVISYCPRLEHLQFDMRNLTRLKELRIIACPKLEELPNRCARSGHCSGGDESERLARQRYKERLKSPINSVPFSTILPFLLFN
ncbi:hypothetical protein ACJRO7_031887 [Eucalyptus globulus]|uniref:Disease resistance protein RGA3 n=1 Tax=Eucalyptus globulus TaxID=34317 RepID=A0ABD3JIS1_EUCGL